MSGLESVAKALTFEAERQPHVLTIAGTLHILSSSQLIARKRFKWRSRNTGESIRPTFRSGGVLSYQADLKTFSAFQCYGASVLTGLTAQNTTGVQGVHPVPTSFVLQQLDSVFNDDVPISIKFGMLTSAETIRALTACPHLTSRKAMAVLDPVMISTSGHVLLPDDAIEALKGLFGVVDWLTPNIPEAEQLAGLKQGEGAEGLVELAKKTAEVCNVPIVLLKGGHSPILREQVNALQGYKVIWEEGDDEGDTIECLNRWRELIVPGEKSDKVVLDILVQRGAEPVLFVGKYVESSSTHGTGCTLSSAIAASYAKLPKDQRGTSFLHDAH
jgi:hydroxymethylpyrimidine/phosphomethylpyrimidine kinase